jgi:hypothetical protein
LPFLIDIKTFELNNEKISVEDALEFANNKFVKLAGWMRFIL